MESTRAPLATLVAVLVLWWLHLRHLLRRLPERIATHFGAAGVPNGWMSRDGLETFDLMFLAFVLTVVVGTAALIRFLPVSVINVPNRDYWFAPERRRQSHARLFAHMLWLACLVVCLLVAMNQLLLLANLRPGQPRLHGPSFIAVLVGFLLSMIAWTVRLYRLFPRPATARPRS